ncbi:MAG: hypothetical protein PUK67_05720 [Prevotellaceae bacterium]|nr:hypothetical protein [Prevotellaceae bacterium]MDY3365657.1 hypothetical protein [Prevotella sp.]
MKFIPLIISLLLVLPVKSQTARVYLDIAKINQQEFLRKKLQSANYQQKSTGVSKKEKEKLKSLARPFIDKDMVDAFNEEGLGFVDFKYYPQDKIYEAVFSEPIYTYSYLFSKDNTEFLGKVHHGDAFSKSGYWASCEYQDSDLGAELHLYRFTDEARGEIVSYSTQEWIANELFWGSDTTLYASGKLSEKDTISTLFYKFTLTHKSFNTIPSKAPHNIAFSLSKRKFVNVLQVNKAWEKNLDDDVECKQYHKVKIGNNQQDGKWEDGRDIYRVVDLDFTHPVTFDSLTLLTTMNYENSYAKDHLTPCQPHLPLVLIEGNSPYLITAEPFYYQSGEQIYGLDFPLLQLNNDFGCSDYMEEFTKDEVGLLLRINRYYQEGYADIVYRITKSDDGEYSAKVISYTRYIGDDIW